MTRLPWIDEELALMRDADQRGVPIIGHCLGGQLLAKAFGAHVTRSAMKEIGWSDVEVDDVQLAREWIGSEPVFDLFQWHGDAFALPVGARRFLTSSLCANQAFVIDRGHHAHLGMQFHVEMTPSLVNGWVSDSGRHARNRCSVQTSGRCRCATRGRNRFGPGSTHAANESRRGPDL